MKIPSAALIQYITFAVMITNNANAQNPQVSDRVFFATGKSGIYSANFSYEDGTLGEIEQKVQEIDSHFIVQHPSLPVIYSINQFKDSTSAIVSYNIAEDGSLIQSGAIDKRPAGAAHINISPDGNLVAVAYYGSSYVGVYSTEKSGAIEEIVFEAQHEGSGPDGSRQKSPHPHWVGFSEDGRFLYVPDLGTDEIWVYSVESATNKIVFAFKVDCPPGSGPRHLAFHPTLPFAWLTNELIGKVTGYQVDKATGGFSEIESVVSAEEAKDELWANVSHLRVHPNGEFLYVINRGFDQVSVFRIDQENGTLSPVEREPIRGHISRSIALSDDGKWALVAGMRSNTMAIFKIDPNTGHMYFMNRRMYYLPTPRVIVIDGHKNRKFSFD